MRILTWHVHAAWNTAFVAGRHEYLIPVDDDRGPFGRGRPRTYQWPDRATEVRPDELRRADVDVVVLQRPEEEELARSWLGRRVPAIYVEHNTPKSDVPNTRHPMADRDDVTVVHVTHFNDLFWDCGRTRTTVIEHGVAVPEPGWTGELPRLAVITNEPVRRGRVTGADLIGRFAAFAPVDVFGIGVRDLHEYNVTTYENPDQPLMHGQLAQRRAYLHLTRWTSLGLSLIEAMHMGCPIVALATTEATMALPAGAGVVSTNMDDLTEAARHYLRDPEAARRAGMAARAEAARRYGLNRFLEDWDRLLHSVVPPSGASDRDHSTDATVDIAVSAVATGVNR
jgi:hypothetical protein